MKLKNIRITLILLFISATMQAQLNYSVPIFHDISTFNTIKENVLSLGFMEGSVMEKEYDWLEKEYIEEENTEGVKPERSKSEVPLKWVYPQIKKGEEGIVEKYGKFEVGLDLSSAYTTDCGHPVEERFEAFIDTTSTFAKYISKKERLNPFNPEEVDVIATFYNAENDGWSEDSVIRYGFYYEEFMRNRDFSSWKDINMPYHMRIRFSPNETGFWMCNIIVKVKGEKVGENEFVFFCKDSENDPYLKVSPNKKYLTLGENGPLFMPVGNNLSWPQEKVDLEMHKDMYIDEYDKLHYRPKAYANYHERMNILSKLGANYFRLIFTPYSMGVEWDELGNYRSKMGASWEMDRILDKAEELGMKIHLNLQIHFSLEYLNTYGFGAWDWAKFDDDIFTKDCPNWDKNDKGNPYRVLDTLGVNSVFDFYTNDVAKKFYKRRLRYYMSRYGYSNEIGVIELVSEINQTGQDPNIHVNDQGKCVYSEGKYMNKPYYQNPSFTKAVNEWQVEMSNYIKKDLGVEYITGVSYTGIPNLSYMDGDVEVHGGTYISGGDSSYYSEAIDIASYNLYGVQGSSYSLGLKVYNTLLDKYKVNKPVFNSEIGNGLGKGINRCSNNINLKKAALLSPFYGHLGMSLVWDEYWLDDLMVEDYTFFKGVKGFFEGETLHEGEWTVNSVRRVKKKLINKDPDDLVESFYLKNKKEKKALGVLHNLSWNYYTVSNAKDCKIESGVEEVHRVYKDVKSMKKKKLKVQIPSFFTKKFTVTYYNPLTNNQVGEVHEIRNWGNKIRLDFPTLSTTESTNVLYYKISICQ